MLHSTVVQPPTAQNGKSRTVFRTLSPQDQSVAAGANPAECHCGSDLLAPAEVAFRLDIDLQTLTRVVLMLPNNYPTSMFCKVGLSAILGVVTVKLHADTICDLIAAKIKASALLAERKAGLRTALGKLSSMALQAGVTDLAKMELNHRPDVAHRIERLVGMVSRPQPSLLRFIL